MKKYNNFSNHMNFAFIFMNVLFLGLIVFFALQVQTLDTIVPIIVFLIILVLGNIVYFILLDQWYITYYDDITIMQKWLNKRKRVDFEQIRYVYLVDNLVILSMNSYEIGANLKKIGRSRRIKRKLRKEICIIINPYDKLFPKVLLSKCASSEIIDFGVNQSYKKLFEID